MIISSLRYALVLLLISGASFGISLTKSAVRRCSLILCLCAIYSVALLCFPLLFFLAVVFGLPDYSKLLRFFTNKLNLSDSGVQKKQQRTCSRVAPTASTISAPAAPSTTAQNRLAINHSNSFRQQLRGTKADQKLTTLCEENEALFQELQLFRRRQQEQPYQEDIHLLRKHEAKSPSSPEPDCAKSTQQPPQPECATDEDTAAGSLPITTTATSTSNVDGNNSISTSTIISPPNSTLLPPSPPPALLTTVAPQLRNSQTQTEASIISSREERCFFSPVDNNRNTNNTINTNNNNNRKLSQLWSLELSSKILAQLETASKANNNNNNNNSNNSIHRRKQSDKRHTNTNLPLIYNNNNSNNSNISKQFSFYVIFMEYLFQLLCKILRSVLQERNHLLQQQKQRQQQVPPLPRRISSDLQHQQPSRRAHLTRAQSMVGGKHTNPAPASGTVPCHSTTSSTTSVVQQELTRSVFLSGLLSDLERNYIAPHHRQHQQKQQRR